MIREILRKIGVVTLRDHENELESFRRSCEEFAKNYLDASRGVTIGAESGFINGGELHKGGVIIGSKVSINDVRAHHLAVAPWCHTVIVNRLVSDKPNPKSHRAVVRCPRSDESPIDCYVGTSQ